MPLLHRTSITSKKFNCMFDAVGLGLVPKQISTGDRTILGKISKPGNKYLRTLFVFRSTPVCSTVYNCW
jgi:Transposase IS116/IS110/IS902 family